MRERITIVYNAPQPSRYDARHEQKAVLGVLDAVTAVERSLVELGHPVTLLPLVPPEAAAADALRKLDTDLVFNLFEGFAGKPESETLVPDVLTGRLLPFTGCRADVLRLALDKVRVKFMLRIAGIPTPDFQVLDPDTVDSFELSFPCIVKPRRDDASHGISDASVVRNRAALKKQVTELYKIYHSDVLVERFITGREFNATVLGGDAGAVLPASEIVYTLAPHKPKLLTFAAKWEPESPEYRGTNAVCPAKVSERDVEHLAATAMFVFRKLIHHGYARVDMRMDERGELNVIEVNPNPDISPDAGAALQAAAAGMTYTDFIASIIQLEAKENAHAR